MASDQDDSRPGKMGWWARRAGIATVAGGLLFMGGRNDSGSNVPAPPAGHKHNHNHGEKGDGHAHGREAHVTEPFSESIEYSAITDALRPDGVKVGVPQSSKEWVKLLSRHYEIHAGFVPSSVAAPSSLHEPRLIISVSDPKRADKRNLSGKLFFGFVYHKDGTRDIEFISHNRQTNEFDFGRIEGAELRKPPIANCLECHTDAKPFPLHFPYHDTNFNPALSQKLIATLLSDDPAVIKKLGEITEAASKAENPGAALNEMLVAEFGPGSKNEILYGGVPLVSRLSLDADLPLFDIETRKAGNAEAIAAYLAKIDKPLRSEFITLSLKHALASDIERTFPRKGANQKMREAAAGFDRRLDRLVAGHKELAPDNAEEIFDLPGGLGGRVLKSGSKDEGIFDIRRIADLPDVLAQNAGKRQKAPKFADAPGLAVNMGAADMPFLIDKTAAGLKGVAADPDKLAMELLADVLTSDRLDKLASAGALPKRDEVMTALVEGIQQEARKQHGIEIAIKREEYIDTSLPVPHPKTGEEGGRPAPEAPKTPMEQHCYSCHGGTKPPKGAIPMDGRSWGDLFAKDPEQARTLYQESIRRVDRGEMPKGRKLTEAERRSIIDWLRDDPSIPRELLIDPKAGKDR